MFYSAGQALPTKTLSTSIPLHMFYRQKMTFILLFLSKEAISVYFELPLELNLCNEVLL